MNLFLGILGPTRPPLILVPVEAVLDYFRSIIFKLISLYCRLSGQNSGLVAHCGIKRSSQSFSLLRIVKLGPKGVGKNVEPL